MLVGGDVGLTAFFFFFFFVEVAIGDDGEWRLLLEMVLDELQVKEESWLSLVIIMPSAEN